jgi:hypothetical protein
MLTTHRAVEVSVTVIGPRSSDFLLGFMKIVELQEKLLAIARANPPSDQVPYAFEKRILARIASEPMVDLWALWSQLLWRAAAPCVGIMLVMSAWTVVSVDLNGSSEPLARDLEETVLAPLASLEESW